MIDFGRNIPIKVRKMINLGKTTPVKVGSKTWIIGRLELRVIDAFGDYVREKIGDPFQLVERFIDKVSPGKAAEMLAEAKDVDRQLQSFSMTSDLAQRFQRTEHGGAYLMMLMMQTVDGQAGATLEDAFLVLQALGEENTAKALAKASGSMPTGNAQGKEVALTR